jgi:hypothetical protein
MGGIIWLSFSLAYLCKIGTAAMALKFSQFFSWFSTPLLAGGIAAIFCLSWLLYFTSRTRALLGAVALISSIAIYQLWPVTEHTVAFDLFRWDYGHLTHFSALSAIITEVWPYGATLILLGIAVRYR